VRLSSASVVLLCMLPVGLLACGDDDDEAGGGAETPRAVRVEGLDYAFDMPDRIKGGVVAMDFSN
jgi:hypothetical protein